MQNSFNVLGLFIFSMFFAFACKSDVENKGNVSDLNDLDGPGDARIYENNLTYHLQGSAANRGAASKRCTEIGGKLASVDEFNLFKDDKRVPINYSEEGEFRLRKGVQDFHLSDGTDSGEGSKDVLCLKKIAAPENGGFNSPVGGN